MAKAKTATISQILEEAEARQAEAETPVRAEVAELESLLPELSKDAQAAAKLPPAIESAWSNGDSSHTAAEHSEALANVTRTEALRKGAASRLKQRRDSLKVTEHEAAEALAQQLRRVLHASLTVEATHASRSGWDDVPEHLMPAVVLVQTTPTESNEDTGGLHSKGIELHYLHHELHAPLPIATLAQDLERATGAVISFNRMTTNQRRPIKLDAWSVPPLLPRIANLSRDAALAIPRNLALQLVRDAEEQGVRGADGYPIARTDSWFARGAKGVVTVGHKPALKAVEKFNGSERTATIEARMHVLADSDLQPELRRRWEGLNGRFLPGVGVCNSANVEGQHFTASFVSERPAAQPDS